LSRPAKEEGRVVGCSATDRHDQASGREGGMESERQSKKGPKEGEREEKGRGRDGVKKKRDGARK